MAHCRLIVSDHFTRAAGTGEAGGAIAHPDFGRPINLNQGGQIMPTALLLAPQVPYNAPPRNVRPSYSPALRDEGIIIILLSRLDF